LRELSDAGLEICVLSAAHGILRSDELIANYDQKMDAERAAELREPSLSALTGILAQQSYAEVFVCTSRTYFIALRGIEELHSRVAFAAPGQGKKLASLRRWLRGGK
jgi:hypothetical protein